MPLPLTGDLLRQYNNVATTPPQEPLGNLLNQATPLADVSVTPGPNLIPRAGGDGRIAEGWSYRTFPTPQVSNQWGWPGWFIATVTTNQLVVSADRAYFMPLFTDTNIRLTLTAFRVDVSVDIATDQALLGIYEITGFDALGVPLLGEALQTNTIPLPGIGLYSIVNDITIPRGRAVCSVLSCNSAVTLRLVTVNRNGLRSWRGDNAVNGRQVLFKPAITVLNNPWSGGTLETSSVTNAFGHQALVGHQWEEL